MRYDVFAWAAIALLLFAAEALAPGAFMLWLGLAATVVFVVVLLVPGLSALAQAVLFVGLGIVSILVYRRWFRGRLRPSTDPGLNKRTAALVGRVVPLHSAIVDGRTWPSLNTDEYRSSTTTAARSTAARPASR